MTHLREQVEELHRKGFTFVTKPRGSVIHIRAPGDYFPALCKAVPKHQWTDTGRKVSRWYEDNPLRQGFTDVLCHAICPACERRLDDPLRLEV